MSSFTATEHRAGEEEQVGEEGLQKAEKKNKSNLPLNTTLRNKI